MRKLRKDSKWGDLTEAQWKRLEGWLFDENLGYEQAVERAREEFGKEVSVASVGRICRRLARERQMVELLEAQATALDLNGLQVDMKQMRETAAKLLAKEVLKANTEEPGQRERFASMTRLLLECEHNEIRRARVRVMERGLEMAAAESCEKDYARLQTYIGQMEEEQLSQEEQIARIHAVLYRVAPDEETIAAAKAEREAIARVNAALDAKYAKPDGAAGAGEGVQNAETSASSVEPCGVRNEGGDGGRSGEKSEGGEREGK